LSCQLQWWQGCHWQSCLLALTPATLATIHTKPAGRKRQPL
jgi:hypothetical protein